MNPNIVFTGGGTAGHVTPNLALIDELKHQGWDIEYLGSEAGIEKEMIHAIGIPFHAVSSGKLRRYFSFKNFLDPFKIILGIIQSFGLLHKLKPDVVFSKGGFVAFPVVVAAWLHRIPVVAHESDLSPGLANRLSFPFINKICLTFPTAKKHFKNTDKTEVTGTPIRQELFVGNKSKGLELCGFKEDKPCLLAIGGSLGAGSINQSLRQALPQLTQKFQVIHLCGKGKLEPSLEGRAGYRQFEYINDELAHLFAAAEVVVSRAGANTLYELLALGKAHILVPISSEVSRGDQIQNARYFEELGISIVLQDKTLNAATLLQAVETLMSNKADIHHKIKALKITSATDKIVSIIKEQAHVQSPKVI